MATFEQRTGWLWVGTFSLIRFNVQKEMVHLPISKGTIVCPTEIGPAHTCRACFIALCETSNFKHRFSVDFDGMIFALSVSTSKWAHALERYCIGLEQPESCFLPHISRSCHHVRGAQGCSSSRMSVLKRNLTLKGN